MKRRRIAGLSVVATALISFQVAGRFEASRIEAQRQTRSAGQAQPANLRIDSERLMAAVTALADPKFEGRRLDAIHQRFRDAAPVPLAAYVQAP